MLGSNLKSESKVHLRWVYNRVQTNDIKIEQMLVESKIFGPEEFELSFESTNGTVLT